MSEIKIESGIPIEATYATGRKSKYPWREMEVGDSFFIDGMPIKHASTRAWEAGRRAGRKFICRRQDNGVRIWRVA